MDDLQILKSIDNKMTALLGLVVLSMFASAEEKAKIKPEVVLSAAGIENLEIAKILGKNLPAVQKTLQRARG